MLTDQLIHILNEMDGEDLIDYVLENFSSTIQDYYDEPGREEQEGMRDAFD